MLGRLLEKGLIEEVEGGRYKATEKGIEALKQYSKVQEEFGKQLEVMVRLGMVGRIFAEQLIDRIMMLASILREDLSKLKAEQRAKYKAFLEAELKRLKEEERS